MGQITTSCAMRLIVLSSIFVTAINAQSSADGSSMNDVFYDTADVATQAPVHAAAHFLKAFIQEEGQPIIKLRWSKTDQIVTNQNLPVWGAQCGDVHESKTKDAAEILKHFVMYQDLKHNSAIVYVTGKELIYGNVGTEYYIHDLPLDLLWKKTVLTVGGPYVKKNPSYSSDKKSINTPPHEIDPVVGTTSDKIQMSGNLDNVAVNRERRHSESVVLPGAKATDASNKFYVETLLFVTYDIVERIKSEHPDDYLFHILLHYAVYFNSIDMLLAKLPTEFRLYVNLAGIIFEEDPDVFSSVIKSPILDYSERNESLVLEGFARLFANYYLLDPDFVLPENSFDLVFISTGRQLQFEDVTVPGQSFGGVDIYDMRRTRTHPMIGIPKSIVKNSDLFTSFAVGAHEIGNVYAYHNPDEEHCIEESQLELPFCDHCLEWSPDTVNGIKKFMRENRNRCWLLNYPQSLRPSNIPVVDLIPSEQCQCFGYSTYGRPHDRNKKHVPYSGCVRALTCLKEKNERYETETTLLPFDGTPCGKSGGKVCWQQKCVTVGVPHHKKPLP